MKAIARLKKALEPLTQGTEGQIEFSLTSTEGRALLAELEQVARLTLSRTALMEDIEVLRADGFADALLGLALCAGTENKPVLVYDVEKCLDVLMKRDGMTYEDAQEFFSFNTEDAFVGELTPIFVYPADDQLRELVQA